MREDSDETYLIRTFSISTELWDQFQKEYVTPHKNSGEYGVISKFIQNHIKNELQKN